MSSTKCSQCGLVNFLSAEHCKRCKASLSAPEAPEESAASPDEAVAQSASDSTSESIPYVHYDSEPEPRRSISPLRILLVILLIVGAAWYLINKDQTERAAQVKKDKQFDQQLRQR